MLSKACRGIHHHRSSTKEGWHPKYAVIVHHCSRDRNLELDYKYHQRLCTHVVCDSRLLTFRPFPLVQETYVSVQQGTNDIKFYQIIANRNWNIIGDVKTSKYQKFHAQERRDQNGQDYLSDVLSYLGGRVLPRLRINGWAWYAGFSRHRQRSGSRV